MTHAASGAPTKKEDVRAALGLQAIDFYVSKTGLDTNTGRSWSDALLTVDAAVGKCTAGAGDHIWLGPGTYDETANGASGVICDIDNIKIVAAARGVTITNTDVTNDGAAITVTAQNVTLKNIVIAKGENTSTGSSEVYSNGSVALEMFGCTIIAQAAATGRGITLTGATRLFAMKPTSEAQSVILGAGVGTGVYVDDGSQSLISDSVVFALGTGMHFAGASATFTDVDINTRITLCTVGAQFDAGAVYNIISAEMTLCATEYIDNSGNATNTRHGSRTHSRHDSTHIPKHAGNIRFVSASGKDTNDGDSPEEPFATILYGLSQLVAGDMLQVRAGTYDEDGIDISLDGIRLQCELGTTIVNTAGGATECLTVSGDNVRICELRTGQAGIKGLVVTGAGSKFCDVLVFGASVGFEISGSSHIFEKCFALGITETGWDIQVGLNAFWFCGAVQDPPAAVRGFYLSTSNADACYLFDCEALGCLTAGYETVTGTSGSNFINCSTDSKDTRRVEGGVNSWHNFMDELEVEVHEHIYPMSDGQGAADGPVAISNLTTNDAGGTTSDRYYWGDVRVVMPIGLETKSWHALGINIHADTANDIQQWECFFPNIRYAGSQNGGNDWDEGETVLILDDASFLEADDIIWVVGDDRADGEIMIVVSVVTDIVTIVSETRVGAGTGLRYDYDASPGNNKAYLLWRPGVGEARFTPFQGDYTAAASNNHRRLLWHKQRYMDGSQGMIMRMLNASDNLDSSFSVTAIYKD